MEKYPEDGEDLTSTYWTQYKIVVPTKKDKKQLQDAFEHFHNQGYNSEYITANQLAHEYLTPKREPGSKNNIVVDKKLFNKLTKV